MIRLNKSNNEKEKILEVVRLALNNPEYELECIFGNDSMIKILNKILQI